MIVLDRQWNCSSPFAAGNARTVQRVSEPGPYIQPASWTLPPNELDTVAK